MSRGNSAVRIIGDFRSRIDLTGITSCFMLLGMRNDDDEDLSFTHIAALTANVLRHLGLEKQKPDDEGTKRGDSDNRGNTLLDQRALADRNIVGSDVDRASGHRRK